LSCGLSGAIDASPSSSSASAAPSPSSGPLVPAFALTSGPNTVNGNVLDNGLPAKIPLEDISVILRFPDGTEKKIPIGGPESGENPDGAFHFDLPSPNPFEEYELDIVLSGVSLLPAPKKVKFLNLPTPVKADLESADLGLTSPERSQEGNPEEKNVPHLCSLHGDNAVVAKLVDSGNKPIKTPKVPEEAVEAILTLPDGSRENLKVNPGDDNAFGFNVKPKAAGEHTLDFHVAGKSALESPIKLKCLDVPADLQASLSGPGIFSGNLKLPSVFLVRLQDKEGNPVSIPKDALHPVISGPDHAPLSFFVTPLDGENSEIFEVSYKPENPGTHVIDVKILGKSRIPKPIEVSVTNSGPVVKPVELDMFYGTVGVPLEIEIPLVQEFPSVDEDGAPQTLQFPLNISPEDLVQFFFSHNRSSSPSSFCLPPFPLLSPPPLPSPPVLSSGFPPHPFQKADIKQGNDDVPVKLEVAPGIAKISLTPTKKGPHALALGLFGTPVPFVNSEKPSGPAAAEKTAFDVFGPLDLSNSEVLVDPPLVQLGEEVSVSLIPMDAEGTTLPSFNDKGGKEEEGKGVHVGAKVVDPKKAEENLAPAQKSPTWGRPEVLKFVPQVPGKHEVHASATVPPSREKKPVGDGPVNLFVLPAGDLAVDVAGAGVKIAFFEKEAGFVVSVKADEKPLPAPLGTEALAVSLTSPRMSSSLVPPPSLPPTFALFPFSLFALSFQFLVEGSLHPSSSFHPLLVPTLLSSFSLAFHQAPLPSPPTHLLSRGQGCARPRRRNPTRSFPLHLPSTQQPRTASTQRAARARGTNFPFQRRKARGGRTRCCQKISGTRARIAF
jgi:hypothetical protein